MKQLTHLLNAIADPTRREILTLLESGDATVSELVAQFDLSQPTISVHLKVLEAAGLITRGKVAQTRPCRFNSAGLEPLHTWLAELEEHV